MTDISKRGLDCDDDCEGERGERGKRGKRGHDGEQGERGHDGKDGRDGDTGPTGSTGPMGEAANTGATGPMGLTGSIGSTNWFVFNPYGVAGGNLYTDWSLLIPAMEAVPGAKVLQFDNIRTGQGDSISAPVAGLQTLTDAAGLFVPAMIGRRITIAGSTTGGSIIPPNNDGTFLITNVPSPTQIEYANTIPGVAEPAFAGVWVVVGGAISPNNPLGTACVIPPGVWDMTEVEWFGVPNPFAQVAVGAIFITISDGASFENFRKMGGEINVTNLNNSPNPAPVRIWRAAIFEQGLGLGGDFPIINNNGTAPFFDCTQLGVAPIGVVGETMIYRLSGSLGGATAAIDMGASPSQIECNLIGLGRINTGAIKGTHLDARLNVSTISTQTAVALQGTPASPFAGSILYGQQSDTQIPRLRMQMFPRSENQLAPVPSAIAFFPATGLGHNGSFQVTSAGVVNQSLPVIRAVAPPNNQTATSIGALNSTGMIVVFKHIGLGSINVRPAGIETIDGIPGPAFVAVPAGGSRIFQSDGVSDWHVIAGYL